MSGKIITIGRQCGSGGHTVGKLVADRLGIPFYDKALVKEVAKRSGLSEEIIESEGEYSTRSLLFNIVTQGLSPISAANREALPLPEQINAYQTELIREFADKGPCVIVGRCADYILRERKDCLHIFIHGDLEDRVERIIHEHGIARAEAQAHVQSRDKKRARYYKYLTDQVWGLAEHYNLCLDSSWLGIERCADIIVSASEING